MTDTRLQKVLAERGIASRRAAERLIAAGRVSVEGAVVTVLGTKVAPDARIEVDARPVAGREGHRYLVLNKPAGIVSTARDERGRPNVVSLVGARERLYPVGRLDAESEGLLLLTNDGAWADLVAHPRNGHEREYQVAVRGHLTSQAIAALRAGVVLDEGTARAVDVRLLSRTPEGGELQIVLVTGWKRQVRRMCAAVGLRVTRLVRVRLGPLALGTLASGAWRELTPREVRALETPPGKRADAGHGRPARGASVGRQRAAEPAPRARAGAPVPRRPRGTAPAPRLRVGPPEPRRPRVGAPEPRRPRVGPPEPRRPRGTARAAPRPRVGARVPWRPRTAAPAAGRARGGRA